MRASTLGWTVALLVILAPRVGDATPCSAGPCAVAEADVLEGPAPLTVAFVGENSLGGVSPIQWRSWDFGDGVPHGPSMNTQHKYLAPGGYTAVLTIGLEDLSEYQDFVFISVTTADGARPPRVEAPSAAPLEGNASFTVTFNAAATDPDGGSLVKHWRLGTGEIKDWAIGNHAFTDPGTYMTRFEAINAAGLRSLSQPFVITVRDAGQDPPLVHATVDKPAGEPPLRALLSATMEPTTPFEWEWDLGDGRQPSTANVNLLYELPGSHWLRVVGTDTNGRKGYDELLVRVTEGAWAAAVVSVAPPRACVGQAYPYAAEARGTPTVTFSLNAAPAGMTVDAAKGLFSWTPTAQQVGIHHVELRAENGSGADTQSFDVEVSCCTDGVCPEPPDSSGCAHARPGAGWTGVLLGLVLAGALLRARRRR